MKDKKGDGSRPINDGSLEVKFKICGDVSGNVGAYEADEADTNDNTPCTPRRKSQGKLGDANSLQTLFRLQEILFHSLIVNYTTIHALDIRLRMPQFPPGSCCEGAAQCIPL